MWQREPTLEQAGGPTTLMNRVPCQWPERPSSSIRSMGAGEKHIIEIPRSSLHKKKTYRLLRESSPKAVASGGKQLFQTPKTLKWDLVSADSSIINQISIAPISLAKPGSVMIHPNECWTAKSKKQFRNINGPSGMPVSMGGRPSQRDVSSDVSWR